MVGFSHTIKVGGIVRRVVNVRGHHNVALFCPSIFWFFEQETDESQNINFKKSITRFLRFSRIQIETIFWNPKSLSRFVMKNAL